MSPRTSTPDNDALFASLRRHIGRWYENAYGSTTPHEAMINVYATSAPRWFNLLLRPKIAAYAETPPARVLDVGCGFAHISVYLASRWPNSEIVATDVSDNYYRSGEAAANELGIRNIRFSTISINELQERENFDLVVCCNMLNFMNTKEKLVDGLVRVWTATKPGGFVTIHTPHFWNLREPFTRIPLLHFLPIPVQDKIVRRLKRRSTLLDVRNPSVGEVRRTLEPLGGRLLGTHPSDVLGRFRSTHATLWMQK